LIHQKQINVEPNLIAAILKIISHFQIINLNNQDETNFN
jgi:hypothetical protein